MRLLLDPLGAPATLVNQRACMPSRPQDGASNSPRVRTRALLVYPRFEGSSFWNYRATCEVVGARYSAAPLGLITVAALHNPSALKIAVSFAALYLHIGPYSRALCEILDRPETARQRVPARTGGVLARD